MAQASPTPPALELALGLATLPLLLGIATLALVSRRAQELGEVSEEVFRGDRLPVLPVPEPAPSDPPAGS